MLYAIEIEDLKTAIDGLNNAIISYDYNYSAKCFGCDVYPENLNKISEDKMLKRLNSLKDIYKQLLIIEENELKVLFGRKE